MITNFPPFIFKTWIVTYTSIFRMEVSPFELILNYELRKFIVLHSSAHSKISQRFYIRHRNKASPTVSDSSIQVSYSRPRRMESPFPWQPKSYITYYLISTFALPLANLYTWDFLWSQSILYSSNITTFPNRIYITSHWFSSTKKYLRDHQSFNYSVDNESCWESTAMLGTGGGGKGGREQGIGITHGFGS